ncbi:MAG TPA: hypothetical protein VFF69_15575 [Phycisphaerales bacterium]|nr:hypothetical protein [Phycisphaerales bacterium]
MKVRLGDVLVRMGVLSESEREEVLAAQRSSGRPFGVLAEELFGVSPRDVERAWAAQYAELSGRVDLGRQATDPDVLSLVERRQAYQFQVLPLRFEGRELVVATSESALPRAMRFAGWALGEACSFVVASDGELMDHLSRAYPARGGRVSA